MFEVLNSENGTVKQNSRGTWTLPNEAGFHWKMLVR